MPDHDSTSRAILEGHKNQESAKPGVRASHKTMYGTVRSDWSLTNGRFELNVELPPNTHATVRLPNASPNHVLESGRPLTNGNGVYEWSIDGGAVAVKIGSGHYQFRIKQ